MTDSKKAIIWRAGLVGAVLIPVVLEFWAMFDKSLDTSTYTKVITGFIPVNIFWLVWGAIVFWVSAHFIKYYGTQK